MDVITVLIKEVMLPRGQEVQDYFFQAACVTENNES